MKLIYLLKFSNKYKISVQNSYNKLLKINENFTKKNYNIASYPSK